MHKKPGILNGALVGALMTAPLMALLYLADQVAGLPFVAYDLFDWLTRILPGNVITRGIDTMVNVITTYKLGETSSTAKTLETLMALALFFGGGIVAGAILFAILHRFDEQPGAMRYALGVGLGIVLGLPLIIISLDVNTTATASDTASVIWLLLTFAAWGWAMSWAYRVQEERVTPFVPGTVEAEPGTLSAEPLSRREFLIRVGAVTATLTVTGAAVGRYLEYRADQKYQQRVERNMNTEIPANLPNADATVQPAPGTRPEYPPLEDHYRIDINLRPPEIDANNWNLEIKGLVDNPLSLTLDDIKNNYEAMDQYITLECISNPIGGDLIGTTRWTGTSVKNVLADAGVQDSATHLLIKSEDGFYETVALDKVNSDPRVMFTYNWDGIPLLYEHGFPLRIYVPDHYGMKQPKWIVSVEAIEKDEDGYWVVRGWDKVAQVRATSVVDVAASDHTFERDGTTYVPVGGIAYAGARGISKVEVKVDDGDWVEAQVRKPLSQKTWALWRYDWPFARGRHTFAVRCYDGDGTMQITKHNPTKPSGATGIDTLSRDI